MPPRRLRTTRRMGLHTVPARARRRRARRRFDARRALDSRHARRAAGRRRDAQEARDPPRAPAARPSSASAAARRSAAASGAAARARGATPRTPRRAARASRRRTAQTSARGARRRQPLGLRRAQRREEPLDERGGRRRGRRAAGNAERARQRVGEEGVGVRRGHLRRRLSRRRGRVDAVMFGTVGYRARARLINQHCWRPPSTGGSSSSSMCAVRVDAAVVHDAEAQEPGTRTGQSAWNARTASSPASRKWSRLRSDLLVVEGDALRRRAAAAAAAPSSGLASATSHPAPRAARGRRPLRWRRTGGDRRARSSAAAGAWGIARRGVASHGASSTPSQPRARTKSSRSRRAPPATASRRSIAERRRSIWLPRIKGRRAAEDLGDDHAARPQVDRRRRGPLGAVSEGRAVPPRHHVRP